MAAVERLPNTDFFMRWKIPLESFMEFPVVDPKDKKPAPRRTVRSFRSHHGLHLTQAFCEGIHPYLEDQPITAPDKSLWLWELIKPNVTLASATYQMDAKKNPVPWWLIDPLLTWQQKGEDKAVFASEGSTRFFMSYCKEGASLSQDMRLFLKLGTLHTEWWLEPLEEPSSTPCKVGQAFLSFV